jgi:catechol 2,3-dioxygenase-like lactoylglutathione lyase family enzyme
MLHDALAPARRFLHVCYCCADSAEVTRFFVDNLAMRNTMSTTAERSSGAILGLEGEILAAAAFLYDHRGPRTSPAIEVQAWVEPALLGTPAEDPTAVGIQALGFSVSRLEPASERLVGQGATIVGSGASVFGEPWMTLRDPRGVSLDLVKDATVPEDESRMHHLRITASDLAVSVPWYEGLGFTVVERAPVVDASWLGMAGSVAGEAVRLRLPDEPFEALLIQWDQPGSHGRHVSEPNHAGLYRTAVGVDDTRASYDAMSAAGVTFDRAPMSIQLRGTPVPDMWICFLSDPDGVPFEFVGRPRSAFRP